ncbi:MAG: hypothetical protein I8H75_04950 [Myxococcaceae bacterium]|nr:hypothetical protein [Myxococcaceae bacterium]MBH2006673.1 hypothetical protein [Myxococcaceae bacterium]
MPIKCSSLLLATLLSLTQAFADVSYMAVLERCTEQNLDPQDAITRNAWAQKCFPQHQEFFQFFAPKRPTRYALVYSPAQNSWQGPLKPESACGDWELKTFCIAACYTPDQRLLFGQGYLPIEEALKKNITHIQVLRKGSDWHSPQFDLVPIQSFSRSWKEAWESIRILTMMSGGILKVTQNHPIVTHLGQIKEASLLSKHDRLLKLDGTEDPIESIEDKEYFGRVYNVEPASSEPNENILVAQGYLVGSAGYQYHPELHKLVECFNTSSHRR